MNVTNKNKQIENINDILNNELKFYTNGALVLDVDNCDCCKNNMKRLQIRIKKLNKKLRELGFHGK